jgi:hypothetical protein
MDGRIVQDKTFQTETKPQNLCKCSNLLHFLKPTFLSLFAGYPAKRFILEPVLKWVQEALRRAHPRDHVIQPRPILPVVLEPVIAQKSASTHYDTFLSPFVELARGNPAPPFCHFSLSVQQGFLFRTVPLIKGWKPCAKRTSAIKPSSLRPHLVTEQKPAIAQQSSNTHDSTFLSLFTAYYPSKK